MKESPLLSESSRTEKTDDCNTPSLVDYETWSKMEFEQGFLQLRDRDERIIDLTKFYITMILSSGSIAIALLSLKDLVYRYFLVGLLLIMSCVVGEMLVILITAFRSYFVICARQLNAIRGTYTRGIPTSEKGCIVQPTDPSYPPMFNKNSAHFIVILLMTFINAALGVLGIMGLISISPKYIQDRQVSISFIAFVGIFLGTIIYVKWQLQRGDRNAQ